MKSVPDNMAMFPEPRTKSSRPKYNALNLSAVGAEFVNAQPHHLPDESCQPLFAKTQFYEVVLQDGSHGNLPRMSLSGAVMIWWHLEDNMDWATVKWGLQLERCGKYCHNIADLLLRRLSILLDCWHSSILLAGIGETFQILHINLIGT